MKYRVITICLLLFSSGWSAHAQEPESKLSEDDRIVVAFDSIWHRQSIGGSGWTLSVEPPGEVVLVWMTLVQVKSGHVGAADKPVGEKASLFDTDGGEHEDTFLFGETLPGEEIPEGVRGELGDGASFVAIFTSSRENTPAVLRWTYGYWDSPESVEAEYAEIEIDLGGIG